MPNNSKDAHGLTPLMKATLTLACDAAHLQALIDAGADVNAATSEGYTPLHCAAMADWSEDHVGGMEVLLKAGAEIEARGNIQGGPGWTPLLLAAAEGYSAQVRTLISWGADVNAVDDVGRTALMLAAARGVDAEISVQALLDAGADAHARCQEGNSALDYAREHLEALAKLDGDDVRRIQADVIDQIVQEDADLRQAVGAEVATQYWSAAGRALDLAGRIRADIESCKEVIQLLEKEMGQRR
jgi:hypothetical protein